MIYLVLIASKTEGSKTQHLYLGSCDSGGIPKLWGALHSAFLGTGAVA